MENKKLANLLSSLEKDIAFLKIKVKESEERKKNLKRQALIHIAGTFPEGYRRILGESSRIKVDDKSLENIFSGLNIIHKSIWGCSISVKNFSVEHNEESLKKNWSVEGQLSQLSFIVDYVTINTKFFQNSASEKEEELLEIQKLDIFPKSEVLESLSAYIITLGSLKPLIPSLYMFQKIQEERASAEERLGSFIEIEMSEENDILTISVDVSPHVFKIKWEFFYNQRGDRFSNNISVFAEDELKMKYRENSNASILSGDELLNNADEVLAFIEGFFKES